MTNKLSPRATSVYVRGITSTVHAIENPIAAGKIVKIRDEIHYQALVLIVSFSVN